jgi:hypothetical protein
MANEIAITLALSASKGGASVNSVGSTSPASATLDMTGTDMLSGTQIVTTTTAALTVGSVTAPYSVLLRNLSTDPTEIIRVGNANADPITSIVTELLTGRPGSMVNVPSGGTLYVESASGSPTLAFTMVEA